MELLDLALSMEEDLKNFYHRQSELHEGNSLRTVFQLLEREEERHTEILRNYSDRLILPQEDSDILSKVRSIFRDNNDFKSEIKDNPSQLDVYRMALQKEEESKKFYQELGEKASEQQSKKVFEYLTIQEDTHCIILEELVKLVNRPEEWVESAEFGIREEY